MFRCVSLDCVRVHVCAAPPVSLFCLKCFLMSLEAFPYFVRSVSLFVYKRFLMFNCFLICPKAFCENNLSYVLKALYLCLKHLCGVHHRLSEKVSPVFRDTPRVSLEIRGVHA